MVRNNAAIYVGKSCYHGAQIQVLNSQNVEIYGNTVRSTDGSNGICAVDIDRPATAPAATKVANLYVHDNEVRMRLSATTGLVGRAAAFGTAANNRFVHNTYYVATMTSRQWAWSTYPVAWNPWNDFGNDVQGTMLPGSAVSRHIEPRNLKTGASCSRCLGNGESVHLPVCSLLTVTRVLDQGCHDR